MPGLGVQPLPTPLPAMEHLTLAKAQLVARWAKIAALDIWKNLGTQLTATASFSTCVYAITRFVFTASPTPSLAGSTSSALHGCLVAAQVSALLWLGVEFSRYYVINFVFLPSQVVSRVQHARLGRLKRAHSSGHLMRRWEFASVETEARPGTASVSLDAAMYLDEVQEQRPAEEQRWLLWFNANGVAMEENMGFGRILSRGLGCNVMLVNFRGVGQSTGRAVCEQNLVDDGCAAFRHLLGRGVQSRNIVLHGHSLGGAVAVRVRARWPEGGGVVNDRSFGSLADVVRLRLAGGPFAAIIGGVLGCIVASVLGVACFATHSRSFFADAGDGSFAFHPFANAALTAALATQLHFALWPVVRVALAQLQLSGRGHHGGGNDGRGGGGGEAGEFEHRAERYTAGLKAALVVSQFCAPLLAPPLLRWVGHGIFLIPWIGQWQLALMCETIGLVMGWVGALGYVRSFDGDEAERERGKERERKREKERKREREHAMNIRNTCNVVFVDALCCLLLLQRLLCGAFLYVCCCRVWHIVLYNGSGKKPGLIKGDHLQPSPPLSPFPYLLLPPLGTS